MMSSVIDYCHGLRFRCGFILKYIHQPVVIIVCYCSGPNGIRSKTSTIVAAVAKLAKLAKLYSRGEVKVATTLIKQIRLSMKEKVDRAM